MRARIRLARSASIDAPGASSCADRDTLRSSLPAARRAQLEGLAAALREVEGPLARVLAAMEAAGLAVSRAVVRAHQVGGPRDRIEGRIQPCSNRARTTRIHHKIVKLENQR